MDTTSILVAGVGGQGTLLTAKVLGNLLTNENYDVKISEIHGMAQRGGSVVTHVRYGSKVYSPIVEPAGADIILSYEKMEALRWAHYLKPGGTMIINDQKILPMPVISGVAEYPENVLEQLKEICNDLYVLDAVAIAEKIGNTKVFNVVILGVLARFMDIEMDAWINTLHKTIPQRFLDLNLRAFELGYITSCKA
jgi:indolepyruvate ferredoxin oxidoreductase, beta subunit